MIGSKKSEVFVPAEQIFRGSKYSMKSYTTKLHVCLEGLATFVVE